MSNIINLLIVDDHQMIIDGYMLAINDFVSKDNYVFVPTHANNCKDGYNALMNAKQPYDLVLLDLNMPGYPEKNIKSGEELAFLARELNPECRLMVLSMTNDTDRLLSLIDSLNPNGLVIKIDLDHRELLRGLEKVMRNLYYYSKSVINLLRYKPFAGYDLDQYDQELLVQMSQGVKPRYLSKCVPLTLEVVARRVTNLHLLFKSEDYKYLELVDIVQKKGLI